MITGANSNNLFMQCDKVNAAAFRPLPYGYGLRLCRKDELYEWKWMWAQGRYMEFMDHYCDQVYAPFETEFYRRCTFVVDANDRPVATSGIWLAYGKINSILGFFVNPDFQGKAIGRALLTEVLRNEECPIFVHTHPIATHAIKLYSDFGFKLITDPVVGYRENNLTESLPYLKQSMPPKDHANLKTTSASPILLEAALTRDLAEF